MSEQNIIMLKIEDEEPNSDGGRCTIWTEEISNLETPFFMQANPADVYMHDAMPAEDQSVEYALSKEDEGAMDQSETADGEADNELYQIFQHHFLSFRKNDV